MFCNCHKRRQPHQRFHGTHANKNVLTFRWSAVSRGAVIAVLKNAYNPSGASLGAGMDAASPLWSMPHVASRIARASYGTVFYVPVRRAVPPVDTAKEKPYTDKEGITRVCRMRWYLKKVRPCILSHHEYMPVLITHHQGEPVQDKDPVIHSFFDEISGPDAMTVSLTLYISDADIPSIWPDDLVRKLCEIQCELDIPWEKMKEMRDLAGKLLPCKKAENLTLSMSFRVWRGAEVVVERGRPDDRAESRCQVCIAESVECLLSCDQKTRALSCRCAQDIT